MEKQTRRMGTHTTPETAAREAVVAAFDHSTGRGGFLRAVLGAGAGVAAAGMGAGLLAAGPASAASPGRVDRTAVGIPRSDIDILNFALMLEHLEAAFYAGIPAADVSTLQALRYVKLIAAQEATHVTALTAAIRQAGGTPVAAAKYTLPEITFPFGTALENLGVQAYLGAIPLLQTPELRRTATSIVTVEARHAAMWAALYDAPDFTQGAFDSGLPEGQVMTRLKATIKRYL
jgi:hypothetical protein